MICDLYSLADYLGDDHDRVVLRAKLTAPGSPLQGNSGCRALPDELDHERAVLRKKALQIGGRIYHVQLVYEHELCPPWSWRK